MVFENCLTKMLHDVYTAEVKFEDSTECDVYCNFINGKFLDMWVLVSFAVSDWLESSTSHDTDALALT